MKNERTNGLPKEVQQQVLWERIGKEYPLLYMERFVLVDTQTTRLAIDDISYRATASIKEDIETLALSCKGWMEIYRAEDMTKALATKLIRLLEVVNKGKTVLIFPGNGAKVVKDLLPEELITDVVTFDPPTKREISPNGTVDGVTVKDVARIRKTVSDRKVETIIVVDDVIVTQATLNALKEAIPGRDIEWYASALCMRSPLQAGKKTASQSGIEGYKAVIVPIVYQGKSGTVPVNSLSTLIGTSKKSEVVRYGYMENYVEDRETFIDAVQSLQKKVNL